MIVNNPKGPSRVRVKLSRIQFPEACPVCLSEVEDLVFVTVVDKEADAYASSSWTKQDEVNIQLQTAKSATTFAIPTCMRHGSKSVRSLRMKLIAALGFFLLFYPILFYLFRINVALTYSRPLAEPLIALAVLVVILVLILMYGLYPRALERAIRFHDVSRVKDYVILSVSNREYLNRFLKLNEMVVQENSTDSSVESDQIED
ncbi:MAG: hypothetical protein EAX87_14335 [Candidatus Thorarchaeota archaeon]|nr:hypothetical protein [Candidatus Thorarchaeota archaeon]